MMKALIPFFIFVGLSAFLYNGLYLNPREIPSPFINKPAPAFVLPQLQDHSKQFSPKDMLGKVWLLNVWASWCVSCKEEHPVLMELARMNIVPIYGLDYKDKQADADNWLARGGNPYVLSLADESGKVGIDYGVYGVPETYVIDKQGVIRYKEIGPVNAKNLQEKILPLVAELQKK
jgi:cytochrome c biogenesis protein CcmG, thiol:disulfide interchange protein DsbE